MNNQANSFLGNTSMPNYVKLMATGILGTTYAAALAVATVDTLRGVELPSIIVFIIGTGVTTAISVLGIHQGATLMESPQPATTGGNADASTPAT